MEVTQERLRASHIGQDPTGRRFLDLMEAGEPTAAQLNEFAIWLSGQGLLDAAEDYFRAALQIDRSNPDVWNNLGMVQVRLGEPGARTSFQRAIALQPGHALAHYNLGTMLDAAGSYDAAIEEFTRALTLDPRLGDPAHNPQAVHNQRLLVVRLGLYGNKAKTLGLPMTSMPGGEPQAKDGKK
jgi:Tfp pilus assembly protein PilF